MQNTPRPTVTNTITSSQVAGHIIQAGTITGGLNLNTTTTDNTNPETSRTQDRRQAYEDTTEPR